MAITHSLLKSNFNFNQQTFHLRPLCSMSTKWSCAHTIALKKNHTPCCIKTSPKFNMKCFTMNHMPEWEKGFDFATETGINGVIWRSMENVMKALRIPVMTAVLLGLLLFHDHHQALAASCGRMGGRSFSSGSSSRSSASRSYSSRGSRPSYSSSKSYSTQTSTPAPMRAANEVEPNGFHVIMTVFVTVFMLYFVIKWYDDQDATKTSVLKLQLLNFYFLRLDRWVLVDHCKGISIGLLSQLIHPPQSLNYILQEAILALLRHSDNCISGYSSVDVKRSIEECEKRFDQLSIEERSKFDEETLVNVNNIRKKSATTQSSNGLRNEYIVVTIIMAARGVPELPPIKSIAQLKKALQRLASIPSSNVMGAEVLWTPQKEDDSLTKQEMLEDYPILHPV